MQRHTPSLASCIKSFQEELTSKHVFNMFYHEWWSGVSCLSDQHSDGLTPVKS
jgi:hypothetical protein